jgi:universal stress protein A
MSGMKKILVATDFSSCARAALDHAIELASATHASLLLLHDYELPTYALPNGNIYSLDVVAQEQIERSIDEQLASERTHAVKRGVDAAVERATGHPADVILRHAAEQGIGLVVMGTHGRRGLKRLFLGSVAEHVLRAAPCPVLVVREREGGSR